MHASITFLVLFLAVLNVGGAAARRRWHDSDEDSGSNEEDNGSATYEHSEEIHGDWDEDCNLPKDPGSCGRNMTRYYFDTKRRKCIKFIWKGCSTNRNNFVTLAKCEKNCGKGPGGGGGGRDVCDQGKVTGNCGKHLIRYYYDKERQECRKFIWKGCRSNDNNFKTLRECRETCHDNGIVSGEEICSLPKDPGECGRDLTRYYYDEEEQKCIKFLFGGCGGNRNNFKSRKACEDKCCKCEEEPEGTVKGVCLLPRKRGTCEGKIHAYYYDKKKKGCFPFIYSGCGGNANNFVSAYQCKKVCMEEWR